MPTLLEWGARISEAALPQERIVYGPWRGSMRSVPADRVPPEYMAGGSDFLYLPRFGAWKRRSGQTQLFDTYGSSTGLLPAKWSSKCRDLQEFPGDLTSDGIPSLVALLTKETIASGLDDGRFSNVWWRDQDADVNHTVGDEFGTTSYPAPGTEPTYKVVPLWYDSGDGGMTRGVAEFQRRFFFGGSRRFAKLGNWHYFPNLYGTPCRWNGRCGSVASLYKRPTSTDTQAGWTREDGGSQLHAGINEVTAEDVLYIKQDTGATTCIIRLTALGAPAAGATHTLRVRHRNPTGSQKTLTVGLVNHGGTTVKSYGIVIGASSDWATTETVMSAGEIALIVDYANLDIEFGTPSVSTLRVSWFELEMSGVAGGTMRMIPSGPLPPTHAGSLAAGNEIVNLSQSVIPDADVTYGAWTDSDSGTSLYDHVNEYDATDSDYVQTLNDKLEDTCEVSLSTIGTVPTEDYSGTMRVRIKATTADPTGLIKPLFVVKLIQGTTNIAQMNVTIPTFPIAGSFADYTLALTEMQLMSITDWTDLRIRVTKSATGAYNTQGFVSFAALSISGKETSTIGGWHGSDRFYYAVAYRFEDDSIWAPTIPRPINDTLANGWNLFTVYPADPDACFDKVVWSNIPIGPYGTKSRILLRTTKIDSTMASDLQLDPTDLRMVWEIKDNTTTTYDDYFPDDDSLYLDVDGLLIRDDLIMPPRSRYVFAGDARVCHAYGGLNPAAIILAPIGRAADWDLNLNDENASLWGATSSYYKLTTTTLTLALDTGSALTTTAVTLGSKTLQEVVDEINTTAYSAGSGGQWRAQVAPGANPEAIAATYLAPTIRSVSSCVVASQSITLSGGGLSAIPVGSFVGGTGVTAGAYISAIVSDTQLTFVGTITAGTKDLTFVSGTGDTPYGEASAYTGYIRVVANSLPGFIYFNNTYLDQFPVEKSAVWMTVASPGAAKSAPNLFSGKTTNKFVPPIEAGISMGGYAVDNGFVVPFANKNCAVRNTRDSGTGMDSDYRLFVLNESRGCCAWNTVAPGNRFGILYTPEGVVAADLFNEMLLSEATYVHAPTALGDFSYEGPLCVAAAACDTDTAYMTARIMRGAIWVNYRSDSGHPDRQVVYDFSSGTESNGLSALRDGDSLWGWSLPLVREATAICEGRRNDGAHLYAWNDGNAGSTGDGRVDEIETTDADNGVAISASIRTPWTSLGSSNNLSAQEISAWHSSPSGATVSCKFYRSTLSDSYTLTPSTSSTLIVSEDLFMLTLPARATCNACYLEWLQTAGGASELRKLELRAKTLPSYK